MSRVAPKHRAPKPEPLAQPDGCFRCGIGGLLGWYDERWWCARHFFAEPGKRWPKPGIKPRREALQPTAEQLQRGETLGRKRHANKEAKGVIDRKSSARLSGEEAHIIGAQFEVVAGDRFKIAINEEIIDGPDKNDGTLACGCTVGMRCRDWQSRIDRVIVSDSKLPLKEPRVDFCLFGLRKDDIFHVLGAVRKEEFRAKAVLFDFGKGDRWTIPLEALGSADILNNHKCGRRNERGSDNERATASQD